jgi:ABC-2 type transport system ATP-binding protein
MTPPVIVVRDLAKWYASGPAVDGLSFIVPAGSVTAFLGPNGAGKTTTIRALLGLVHADRGEALVLGRPFSRLENPLRSVGVLLDGAGFHPARTARKHLRAVAAAARTSHHRVDEVLDLVDLSADADRRVGGFSLGMRQRLGLATALIGDPELLVLDEPANGLDPAGMRWLRDFLTSFAASGRSVLVSSHVLSEVALVADEVVVIHRGRLVEQTRTDRLTTASVVVVRSPDRERLRRALVSRGMDAALVGEDELEVPAAPVELVGRVAADERVVLHGLGERTSTLEDVFLDLTSRKEEDGALSPAQ